METEINQIILIEQALLYNYLENKNERPMGE